MNNNPISHVSSYYAATANEQADYPVLDQMLTTDICIIGGGFSGITTALECAERGFEVVVLEGRKVGWGASGRNGGQLIRGIGHGLESFRSLIGQEGIDAIDQMGLEAVQIVKDRVAQHNIACDLKMGYLDVALKARHMKELEEDVRNLEKFGYEQELSLIGREQLQQFVGADRYMGGLYDRASGHLHPLNLCLAEARIATNAGAQIFEQSMVEFIDYGNTIRVKTARGSVNCSKLVICGNAYQEQLEPRLGGKVLPAGSYIIATEPLPVAVHHKLLPQDSAICDMGVALDYFRLSADKRLLFGGLCNYSGRNPKNIVNALRPNMLRVFPQLSEVKIDYAWGGMIGIGANRMPQIGRLQPDVYYAQAYAGHGVNVTHMAGKVIAEAIGGNTERFDLFNKIKHITFPGGRYLRSPLLAAGMLYHRFVDLF